ncbi:Nicotianamine synthase protein [Alkalispirochaeta americana]|uniref:Nicotianamine synthase protein n=1 Tax=Alkalispirochaeta americana TaxID=159291 RepID=A0A1N6PTY2_9SPIO|nr:class I SAM-dependent methyltransferase [Alkalispirochaeta americana]SIQ07773.1 Nicotianamine synthase protein [Alkalispirochaeta americana]
MPIIKPLVAAFEKLCASSRTLFWCYAAPYRGVVSREISLSGIGEGDRVLAIGCGSLPFTAVLVATLAKAQVVAVDIDPVSVLKARELIQRLGLSSRIQVLAGDAASITLPQAEVALVALQAAPKKEILDNLARSLSDTCGRVLLRLPRPGLEGQYGLDSSERFLYSARAVYHSMPTFDRSVMVSFPSEPSPEQSVQSEKQAVVA